MAAAPIYVLGDIHGQFGRLVALLAGTGLIHPARLWTAGPAWTGGAATLWFLGDLVDRGPSGLQVIDLVRRLQREAAAEGGTVGCLLGNHEVQLLAARRFADGPSDWGGAFLEGWQRNGGQQADLDGLTTAHITWLRTLPALALVGDNLLIHADALFYPEYGDSIDAVNTAFVRLLAGDDQDAWDRLLVQFVQRRAFEDSRADGVEQAAAFLARYGGRRLVHGHTTIASVTEQNPATVTGPRIYAGGLCVNCDGGLYKGGPGFLYRLPAPDAMPE